MDEHKWPIFWCGGQFKDQDVSIRLVPNQVNLHLTTKTSHQALAELKVHSKCLRKCSKYFETCFNERWANQSSEPSSIECELEVQGEITCYEDCFSRMYTPLLLKNFKDVSYSLQLLRVASQIQFQKLMSSICQYLSTIPWSIEDETKIREYTSSQDFPRNYAKDLVARLDLDMSNEDCHKQACSAIEQFIRGDFCLNKSGGPGNLCEELLLDINEYSESSTFAQDVVTILNKEAKDVILKLYEECIGKSPKEVPELPIKVTHVCRVMEALLEAQVAEEVVEYFLQFELYPKILCNTEEFCRGRLFKEFKFDLWKFILHIFQEVVVGNLLLGVSSRVALLHKWGLISLKSKQTDVSESDYQQIVQDLFLTLPFKHQMELIKLENNDYNVFIDSHSLATLLKSKWPVEEDVMKDGLLL